MKNECKEFLEDYIKSNCVENGQYDFDALFKQYSAFEIQRKEDIKPAIDEFFAFLTAYDKIIIKKDVKNPPKLVKYSANVMKRFFDMPMTPLQKRFAEIVKAVAPQREKTILLEVGAGLYPKTAIYLAQTFQNVHAMDKQFILSEKSMKSMKVQTYQQYFDLNTQIQDFDFIVGRCPCHAIESIVSVCAKQNKPYLIELCDCALPKDKKNKNDIALGWGDILKYHDPNIQEMAGGFVFNIDANKKQMNKVILRTQHKEKKNMKKIEFVDLSYYFQDENII